VSGFRRFEGMSEGTCTTKNHRIQEDLNMHICIVYIYIYTFLNGILVEAVKGEGHELLRALAGRY
jgi:hypothetical protein